MRAKSICSSARLIGRWVGTLTVSVLGWRLQASYETSRGIARFVRKEVSRDFEGWRGLWRKDKLVRHGDGDGGGGVDDVNNKEYEEEK
jgi:hypothetical protein